MYSQNPTVITEKIQAITARLRARHCGTHQAHLHPQHVTWDGISLLDVALDAIVLSKKILCSFLLDFEKVVM